MSIDYTPYVTACVCVIGTAFLYWHTKMRSGVVLQRIKTMLRISEIEELSPDTKRIRLAFPRSGMKLGLPVGKHFKLYAKNPSPPDQTTWNGRDDPEANAVSIERQYTPVTGDEVTGYVDLFIKIYRPGTFKMPDGRDMTWADGGKMTTVIDEKVVGDYLEINGPFGLIEYKGCGQFKLPGVKDIKTYSHVNMMAGGSGITPMLQILQAAIRNTAYEKTKFSLIYANKTESDILCKKELLEIEKASNGKIIIDFTLDFAPDIWKYSKGYITQDMIKKVLASKDFNPLTLLCGPPPMVEFACKKNLFALGYSEESVVCF